MHVAPTIPKLQIIEGSARICGEGGVYVPGGHEPMAMRLLGLGIRGVLRENAEKVCLLDHCDDGLESRKSHRDLVNMVQGLVFALHGVNQINREGADGPACY